MTILLVLSPFFCISQDSTNVEDSTKFGDKFMEKMNFTKNLEFFQSLNDSKSKRVNVIIDEAEAGQWEGKYIRTITIEVLDPFGHIPPEDLKRPKFLGLANKLHQTTTDRLIRQQLLFEEGERVVPELLVATHQILYASTYFRDATIYVQQDPEDEDIVDIRIFVQDLWSWALGADADGDHIGGKLIFNKFAGLPLRLATGIALNFDKRNPVTPKLWFNFLNIGGTFMDVSAYLSHDRFNYSYEVGFRRGFFSSVPQWAGGAKIAWYKQQFKEYGGQAYMNSQDLWVARSFPLNYPNKDYMNIVLAGRIVRNKYTSIPIEQSESLAQDTFLNITHYLVGVGVANRQTAREANLFDFFPYHYVPSGFNMHLVGGIVYNNHLMSRGYLGATANHGLMTCAGYFQEELSAATYINEGLEQLTYNLKSKYFTPLFPLKKWGFRQYLYQNFKISMMRPEGVHLLLDFNDVKGIKLKDYNGSSFYSVNLETEFYSPMRFMGFQARIFGFADIGLQGNQSNIPLAGAIAYQAYGVGVRLNNWKLGLAAIEFSLVYYPKTIGLYNKHFEISQSYFHSKVVQPNNLYSWESLVPVN